MRIIKQYTNRKYYDLTTSAYTDSMGLISLVKSGEPIKIIDSKTKNDITKLSLFRALNLRTERTDTIPDVSVLVDRIKAEVA